MLRVIKSILAAFIGVQSNKNRLQDFTHGKASHFIIAGIIGVVLFIAFLVIIVNIVLSTT
ncbi:DUF2970 domain-containing protein [Litorilituus lipolyticus]|uniref:DUF2970 domain-containing protein n=1 Tax=Litorilituus lipolyticus TaxID=2491017 RepID=A0A502L4F4_9GAMM|nr:DUF2970 domain-containing protein [Litorilituus lipolyticus]TPH15197.1 DUF2970 domain-containing protein [Litorilituus lipolyticus]